MTASPSEHDPTRTAGHDNASGSFTSAQARVRTWQAWVASRYGWPRRGLAFAAGSVSVLALAPFFAWPVLFLTLPILVWLTYPFDGAAASRAPAPLVQAAATGWWFGFGYFFFGLFWIGEAFLVEADTFGWLLPFAVTLMPAGLALFYAGATAAAAAVSRPGPARVVSFAISLGLAEWLRGHVLTGFPWNVLGYALTWPLPLMQMAGLIGIYGLTVWAVLIFAAPLVVIADRAKSWTMPLALAGVPLVLFATYGMAALDFGAEPAAADATRVRIVQPSVPQREKWRPQNQRAIFDLHLELSRRNPAGESVGVDGIDLLVWPEAAMPFFPLEQPQALADIRAMLGAKTYLVTGGLRRAARAATDPATPPKIAYFNSLMIIGRADEPTRVYDKIHLVPFGEYLPLQAMLEAIGLEQLTRLRGGFTPGPSPRPLLNDIGPLICYEAIFPGTLIQGVERPRVFINLTNDGWFGNTTGPRQHLHQARVRAVEEGIPIVRAANNGISALIGADGALLSELGMNQKGVLDVDLPATRSTPPYGRWGDTLFLANLLIFALLLGYLQRQAAHPRADARTA